MYTFVKEFPSFEAAAGTAMFAIANFGVTSVTIDVSDNSEENVKEYVCKFVIPAAPDGK